MITPKKAVNIKGPECNAMQKELFAYYRKCQALKKPCLVMILKPRQKGASTIAEGLIYHHMRRNPNLKGLLMGDVQATSDKVFEMYRQYAKNDDFHWGDEFSGLGGRGIGTIKADKDGANEIVLENGSKFYKETAGSPNAGRSGTVQVGHWDEEAWYPKSETRDPMLASLNSFYDEDEISLGIRTSTANGPSGAFYDDWMGDNEWYNLFAPWYAFEDSKIAFRDEEERREFVESMEDYEVEEMERFPGKVSLEHMKWWRRTLKNKCKGDVNRMRQENPSDSLSCFNLSSRPRFDMGALGKMKEAARIGPKGERGILQPSENRESVAWLRDPQGDFTKYEDPKYGCKYLVSVDTCSGEDQQMGGKTADPDWHDLQVWRAGYQDPRDNTWHIPKVVLWHKSQVDSDLLVELIASASIYYGHCLVVPEKNGEAGVHVIKLLQDRWRIPVYRRKRPTQGQRRQTREERLEAYGFHTNRQTKKYIVDLLVEPIREMEVDFSDVQILEQFETFVKSDKGEAKALPGCHDDSVMAGCIGYAHLNLAKELMRERRKIDLDRLARDPTYLSPDRFKVDLYGLNKR